VKTRSWRLVVLALVSLLARPSLLSAHSGGTDSCGGHHDRKSGGYHVHSQAKYCACHPDAAGCAGASAPSPKPTNPGPGSGTAKPGERKDLTVFVTKSGTKYHRDGCRYLASSRIPMSLSEASQRYGPCSVCKPPVAGG
jgi:hypothetical protein